MVKRRIETPGKPMYQLIMIDYKMPQMSGAKAVQKILEHLATASPQIEKPYIVCMSNYGDSVAIFQSCDSVGMDELVCKPIFKICIYRLLSQAHLAPPEKKSHKQ